MSAEDLDDGGIPDPNPADKGGDDNADDLAVEVQQNGKTLKMAPVSAVIEHRRAARAAGERASRAETENATLKAQLDKMTGDLQALTPALTYLKDHPHLLRQGVEHTRPSSSNTDADPDMIELAKDWELFDAEGKPDAARAARILGKVDRRIDKAASDKVAPLVNNQVRDAAGRNLGILNSWVQSGHVSQKGVDDAKTWLKSVGLPDEAFAHDGIRDIAYLIAKGLSPQKAAEQVGLELDPGPLHRESAGGRRSPTSGPLPSYSKRIADRLGKSTSDYSKLRDNDSDVLE